MRAGSALINYGERGGGTNTKILRNEGVCTEVGIEKEREQR